MIIVLLYNQHINSYEYRIRSNYGTRCDNLILKFLSLIRCVFVRILWLFPLKLCLNTCVGKIHAWHFIR